MDFEDKLKIGFLGFIGLVVISYCVNFVKFVYDLTGINWKSMADNDWGTVIVHAIGVFTGLGSTITVWF